MSLLNDPFPILETYTEPVIRYYPYTQPTSGLIAIQSFFSRNDAWYCMFTTAKSFKHFSLQELMGPETYEKVLARKAFVILDLSFEPFLESIDNIYIDVVKKFNIPPSQVIFMSNMYDAYQYNQTAAQKHGCRPMRVFWFAALEWMLNQYALQVNPQPLQNKNYQKKFLNLNRRWRSHRPLLTLLLHYYGLIEEGHISFGPCENGSWDKAWDGMKASAAGNEEMLAAIERSSDIKNMPPLYLDTDDLNVNRPELDMSVAKYYEDTYFSVVSETTFYYNNTRENSRFITEKTFKAIIMKHPFILVTIPKSLEVLKDMGYKTFHPLIDESYDQEMDDNKRMMMIVKEIERLCNLSPEEVDNLVTQTRSICEYNYLVLRKKRRFLKFRT